MKYTITINQAVLAETSLDLLDAAILDYLYVYCNSLNEKIEAQRIRDERIAAKYGLDISNTTTSTRLSSSGG